MMTSSNGNIFRVTGHLCGEFTGPRWIPHTKASDAELWCFFLIGARINGWVNNREAGDLRRHQAHCDVSVMYVGCNTHPRPNFWGCLTKSPLNHLPLINMDALSQTTFSSAFSWMKTFRISLKFVPKNPINNKSALVHVMAWRQIGDKPLSEPMLTKSTDVYIYVALGGDELSEFKASTNNCITQFYMDIITYPYPQSRYWFR